MNNDKKEKVTSLLAEIPFYLTFDILSREYTEKEIVKVLNWLTQLSGMSEK